VRSARAAADEASSAAHLAIQWLEFVENAGKLPFPTAMPEWERLLGMDKSVPSSALAAEPLCSACRCVQEIAEQVTIVMQSKESSEGRRHLVFASIDHGVDASCSSTVDAAAAALQAIQAAAEANDELDATRRQLDRTQRIHAAESDPSIYKAVCELCVSAFTVSTTKLREAAELTTEAVLKAVALVDAVEAAVDAAHGHAMAAAREKAKDEARSADGDDGPDAAAPSSNDSKEESDKDNAGDEKADSKDGEDDDEDESNKKTTEEFDNTTAGLESQLRKLRTDMSLATAKFFDSINTEVLSLQTEMRSQLASTTSAAATANDISTAERESVFRLVADFMDHSCRVIASQIDEGDGTTSWRKSLRSTTGWMLLSHESGKTGESSSETLALLPDPRTRALRLAATLDLNATLALIFGELQSRLEMSVNGNDELAAAAGRDLRATLSKARAVECRCRRIASTVRANARPGNKDVLPSTSN
jgi:hypothetical protein